MTQVTQDRTDADPGDTAATTPDVRRVGAGPAMPTWAVLASLGVALVAALAFFITGSPDRAVRTDASRASAPPAALAPTTAPPQAADPAAPGGGGDDGDAGKQASGSQQDRTEKRSQRDQPAPTARTAAVDVYNNSPVTGLAAQTSAALRGLGWTVGNEDNWYGDISENTVYYPAALADQAERLADDLGIARVRPAVSPMSFDRLTLILTSTP